MSLPSTLSFLQTSISPSSPLPFCVPFPSPFFLPFFLYLNTRPFFILLVLFIFALVSSLPSLSFPLHSFVFWFIINFHSCFISISHKLSLCIPCTFWLNFVFSFRSFVFSHILSFSFVFPNSTMRSDSFYIKL